MINIIRLIFNMANSVKAAMIRSAVLTKLQAKYPTCQFYPGAVVDRESVLGDYIVVFNNSTIFESTIGDHTYIQRNSLIHMSELGKYCSIAMNVIIGTGQHPTDQVSTHPAFYSIDQPIAKTFSKETSFLAVKKTTIGNDVWIGQNAVIMDGINIETGAIIAAGAVVTKDVPSYAIVGGVPAKIIKYRFGEETRNRLMELEWWNKSDEWLTEYCIEFGNPSKFLKKYHD